MEDTYGEDTALAAVEEEAEEPSLVTFARLVFAMIGFGALWASEEEELGCE